MREELRGDLLRVAVGMAAKPVPRAGENGIDLRVTGLPAKLAPDLRRAGDQGRWISGTSRLLLGGNRATRHAPRRLDDLADSRPIADSQVVNEPRPFLER